MNMDILNCLCPLFNSWRIFTFYLKDNVSVSEIKDVFINAPFSFFQGKAHRDKQLIYLKDHLDKYYYNRDRKWIVLFPEGGFLRKRRETSQLFAKKHSLPHLTHVTLPRLGATHVILKTLSAQQENGSLGCETRTTNQTGRWNNIFRRHIKPHEQRNLPLW